MSVEYRLFITDRALDDLRGIRDYIAADSLQRAVVFLEKLLGSFDALERFPGVGPLAIENDLVSYELRQLSYGSYRVLYRIVGNNVEILHVRHAARLPALPDELP